MTIIKAIETKYKGYRFRSRLEARWAVFFDALALDWQYEPEGFDLGSAGWYLPDFYLPELELWVEVKPCSSMVCRDTVRKAEALFEQGSKAVAIVAGKSPCGYLLDKQSRYGEIFWRDEETNFDQGYMQTIFCAETTDSGGGHCVTGFEFSMVDRGDALIYVLPDLVYDGARERSFYSGCNFTGGSRFIDMPDGRKAPRLSGNKTYLAAIKARSARFEHGDAPC